MRVVQSLINLIIPSSSAMAGRTMPIMTPLTDLLEIQRQTAVFANEFGDGITNLILPSYAALMDALGLARVPCTKWFRFIWPLTLTLIPTATVIALDIVAQAMVLTSSDVHRPTPHDGQHARRGAWHKAPRRPVLRHQPPTVGSMAEPHTIKRAGQHGHAGGEQALSESLPTDVVRATSLHGCPMRLARMSHHYDVDHSTLLKKSRRLR